MRFWFAEHADVIFYGLLIGLTLAEIFVVWIIRMKKEHIVREYVESAFVAIVLALVIRTFLIQTFIIPSGSMENTLLIGDQLIVNKFIYGTKIPGTDKTILKFHEPKRGDIIVFKDTTNPKKLLIKRCLGLPGDVLEYKSKNLYINGQMLSESYTVHKDLLLYAQANFRDNFGPFKVPTDKYFMMGDNRDYSLDSRFWGFLPRQNIEGQAWVIYWPIPRWRVIR